MVKIRKDIGKGIGDRNRRESSKLPRPEVVTTLVGNKQRPGPVIRILSIHTVIRSLWLSLFLVLPAWAGQWQYDGVDRIVAMADIHGAYGAMVTTLENAEVIDADGRWIAGTTHLVICGDILDRGPDSRPAMDLLMRLETEAEAAGGRVHVLLGNHEIMNLVGDMRYVAAEEYAAFADEETSEERERWFAPWSGRQENGELDADALRARFDDRFPAGFFAHRKAFASDGYYGKWLLQKPVLVVINGTAFVHGGVSPLIAELGLDGVNGKLMNEVRAYLRYYESLAEAEVLLPTDNFYNHTRILEGFVAMPTTASEITKAVDKVRVLSESDIHLDTGPLWYRGNVACSRLVEEDRLVASLEAIGAHRVVVGHTPTPTRQVLQRFDGRIIEVDTGMLAGYYNGRGHALVIEGDSVRVAPEIDGSQAEPLPHPRRVGARGGAALSVDALEELLATGTVGPVREDEAGRQIVSVSNGERSVDALFAKRAGRDFYPDVAAYRLDRLIELDMVPVAVVREVDGDDGSLQFLPARWMDEQSRSAAGRGASATCPLNDQWPAMYLFDSVIYNEGRSLARMLYSTDNWQLVLVGHDNAFASKRGKPRHLQQVSTDPNAAWRAALAALDEAQLEAELGDVLDKRRRRMLLNRIEAMSGGGR